ncbi:MAG: eIF2A-related protein [Pyrinomonadaceae bacterium]
MKSKDRSTSFFLKGGLALLAMFIIAWACSTSPFSLSLMHAASQTASRAELVLQTGHAMGVDTMAFSPDGKWLASGSVDNTVKLWEVATGREVRTLTAHTRGVKAVAFSHDGRSLVTGALDNTVRLWDVASGREMRRLDGCGSVSALALSDDGRFLASGNMEKTIKLWNTANGDELRSLTGHLGSITTLAFNPDSSYLASGSADGTIKLWDVAFGRSIRSLTGHRERVRAVAFSSDGQLLASGSDDAKVKIWKVKDGREQRTLAGNGKKILTVFFRGEGQELLSGSSDQVIKVWEIASGRELRSASPPASENGPEAIAMIFNPSGTMAALSTGDKTIRLQDVVTGSESRSLRTHSYGVYTTAFSPDGRWFAAGGKENAIKLWETATGREVRTLEPNSGFINTIMFSPDGGLVAAGGLSGTITLWESSTGRKIRGLVGHSDSVNGIAFSPDGRILASASGDTTLKLWEVETGRETAKFSGHGAEVNAVAFSSDGEWLASGSADKTIKLWNSGTGREVRTLSGHTAEILAVAVSKDGQTLASGGVDKTIKLWDVKSGTETRSLMAHDGEVKALAFSPDGKQLVSGSKDNTIKTWDVAKVEATRTLTGHSNEIYSIAFSPGGQWFASGSDDGSTRIWDARTGDALATLVSLRESSGGLSARQTDWLVASPDGLFDGSPNAWNQILWRFEQYTFNIRPVEAFFNEYYYPGLLAEILAGKRPKAPQDISRRDRRQPRVTLAVAGGQAPEAKVSSREIALKIEVTEAPGDKDYATGSGARDVRLFRNGSLVKVWRGDVLANKGSKTLLETSIPVIAGENQLTAYVFNRDNVKSPDSTLHIIGSDNLKRPATAYLLAVGVNSYANKQYDLKYAVPDATDFSKELRRQQNLLGRFDKVEVLSLLNEQATKANITHALERLAGMANKPLPDGAPPELEKFGPTQPEDTVVVYFAGHGLAHEAGFYMLPHDLGYKGSRRRINEAAFLSILSHSISDRELEQAFERISAGQVLLVIDACNSGQALEAEEKRRGPMNSKGLAQLAYEKGMYILTAAQSYQAALEVTELGHGLLTYALVEEGLKLARADVAPRDGRVMLQEWLDYATERVPEMQEQKLKQDRGAGTTTTFVEGDESEPNALKRSLQRPRVFYRRDMPVPLIAISQQSARN